jgi:hypothetical protein
MIFFKKKTLDNIHLECYLLFRQRFDSINELSDLEEGVLIAIDDMVPSFTAKKVLVKVNESRDRLYKEWELVEDFTFPSSILGHFLHKQHKNLEIFSC